MGVDAGSVAAAISVIAATVLVGFAFGKSQIVFWTGSETIL
jgi:hypothetical protein